MNPKCQNLACNLTFVQELYIIHGYRVCVNMIVNFKDKLARDVFDGVKNSKTKKIDSLLMPRIIRKLDMVNAASHINDLKVPPANYLKKLTGELKDYHSIRINDQWKIIFRWEDNAPHDVQYTDYH